MIAWASFAALVLTRLFALASALVAAGWPDLTVWWRETFDAFMRSGCRQLVARVGRRGFKSSSACVFAVAFAIAYSTLNAVPPGDIGWVVFVSVSKEEAQSRLRTVAKILDVIGIRYEPSGDTIVLSGTNIGFRVQACTVASVSGWTSILIIADEVSKWSDRDTGSNPATEVLNALRPTMSTQKLARILLLSSPLSLEDAHAKAVEIGDNSFQMVVIAPTWIASDNFVTEEETHGLEPDPKVWAREYAAIPSASLSEAFDQEARERCFRAPPSSFRRADRYLLVDWSSVRKDASTFAIAGWSWPPVGELEFLTTREYLRGIGWLRPKWQLDAEGKKIPNPKFVAPAPPFFHVEMLAGFSGGYWKGVSASQIVEQEVEVARKWGVTRVLGDQRESFLLASEFARHGFSFNSLDWTNPRKVDAVERIRRWMREGMLIIQPHEKMRAELAGFQEKFLPSGAITYAARGSGHDDYVALLMTAAMADAENLISDSPHTTETPIHVPNNIFG